MKDKERVQNDQGYRMLHSVFCVDVVKPRNRGLCCNVLKIAGNQQREYFSVSEDVGWPEPK